MIMECKVIVVKGWLNKPYIKRAKLFTANI